MSSFLKMNPTATRAMSKNAKNSDGVLLMIIAIININIISNIRDIVHQMRLTSKPTCATSQSEPNATVQSNGTHNNTSKHDDNNHVIINTNVIIINTIIVIVVVVLIITTNNITFILINTIIVAIISCATTATPTNAAGLELWAKRSLIILQRGHPLLAQPTKLLAKLFPICGIMYCFVAHAVDIPGYGMQEVVKWWRAKGTRLRELGSANPNAGLDLARKLECNPTEHFVLHSKGASKEFNNTLGQCNNTLGQWFSSNC